MLLLKKLPMKHCPVVRVRESNIQIVCIPSVQPGPGAALRHHGHGSRGAFEIVTINTIPSNNPP